jgi:hypothetical protein
MMRVRGRDPAGGMFGVPGFHPRAHALLKVGDDLAGDAAVNVADGVGHFLISLLACEAAAAASCPSARPGQRAERGFSGDR